MAKATLSRGTVPALALFAAVAVIAGPSACSDEGGAEEPGPLPVAPEVADFAGELADAVCTLYAGCTCGGADPALCREVLAAHAGQVMVRAGVGADELRGDCLEALVAEVAGQGCEPRLPFERLGAGCGAGCSIRRGSREAGESCAPGELFGLVLDTCAPGLACGADRRCASTCEVRFTGDLLPDEPCAQDGAPLGTCAEGLVCAEPPGRCTLEAVGEPAACELVEELLQAPSGCLADAQCSDGDPCTADRCDGGACTFGASCEDHGACDGEPAACTCEVGYEGTVCERCAFLHEREGARCVPAPDPDRYLLAGVRTEEWTDGIAALDLETGVLHPLLAIGFERPVTGLVAHPTDGKLYLVDDGWPKAVLKLDLRAGTEETLASLNVGGGGYHSADGLALDPATDVLYGHAMTGAAGYLWSVALPDGRLRSTTGSRSDWNGLFFRDGTLFAAVENRYGPSRIQDVLQGGTGVEIAIPEGLTRPSVTRHRDGRHFLAGNRKLDDDSWARVVCERAAQGFGVDVTGLPARGTYHRSGIAADLAEVVSEPAGPSLFGHASYGDRDAPRAPLRIATTNPGDVICLSTYEETLDVTVAAQARFALLVLSSFEATFSVAVEDGFAPSGTLSQPVKVVALRPYDTPPATAAVVHVLTEDDRWAAHVPVPSVDPELQVTPLVAELDPVTGAVSGVRELSGMEGARLTGGLTALP